MGSKEEPMITYYEDARHFAWLVNGWIYHGNRGIDPTQIKPKNIKLTGRTGKGKAARTRTRYRDISKTIGNATIFLIIGTEFQSFVDYSMPVRVMDYDSLEYKDQIQAIHITRRNEAIASGRTPGVDLSPLKKEDRLVPVITLVLYMGEDPWNAAKRLHELLDFSEIPHELRNYVPDYPIHVLDICHTADERLLEFPKDLASMFLTIKYQKKPDTLKAILHSIPEFHAVEKETFDAVWGFLDKRLLKYKVEAQNAEGDVNMCVAIDMMLADERKQGHERGLSEGLERGRFEGRSLEKEFLILKMLKNNLSIDQIATITDKTADEIQAIAENQKPNTTP